MKIGIIASSLSDLHLAYALQGCDHEYHVFLDNQYGGRGNWRRSDSVARLHMIISTPIIKQCDMIIIPPVYELYMRQQSQNASCPVVLPLFASYVQRFVLPLSKVGKIGVVGPRSYELAMSDYWPQQTELYTPVVKQASNKHLQKQFPLYTVQTDHRTVLYDLPRSWFVHKLIKTDLKKLKDYNIDTLLPLDYGYFAFAKAYRQACGSRVRFHDWGIVTQVAHEYLQANQSGYSIVVHCTGDVTLLQQHKHLLRSLSRGKHYAIQFDKVVL